MGSRSAIAPARIAVLTALAMVMATLSALLKSADGDPGFQIVMIQVSGIGFLIAGLLTWITRPEFRTGEMMVWVAIALYMEDFQLSRWNVLHSVGLILANASTPVLAQLVLTYPTGRIVSPVRRMLIIGAYVVEVGLQAARVPFMSPVRAFGADGNLFLIKDEPDAQNALELIQTSGLEVLGVLGLGLLVVAFWRATSTQRRTLAPAYGPGFAILAVTLVSYAANLADYTKPITRSLEIASEALYLLWPLGFLGGALTSRTSLSSVARLAAFDGGQAELTTALRHTLRDPNLRLLDPHNVVPESPERVHRVVVHHGEEVAVLDHHVDLLHEPQLLAGATSVIGVTLYNRRLRDRAERQRDEVRLSRLRIVEAGMDARRRIERDLHDGTQQRLLTTIINQRLIADELSHKGVDTSELTASTDELERTLQELREIARGVHPALVSERGLGAAIEDLVARTPLPVKLAVGDLPALDRLTSTALFFAVSEALTNVVRHAEAEQVWLEATTANGNLELCVRDDGRGGADATGDGLRGLADRLQALGGELIVDSPHAAGTSLLMRVPVANT